MGLALLGLLGLMLLAGTASASVCRWDSIDTWTCVAKGEPEDHEVALTADMILGGPPVAVSEIGWTGVLENVRPPAALDVLVTYDEAIRHAIFPPEELFSIGVTNDPIWRDHLPGDVVPLCLFYQERRVVVNPCQ